MRPAATFLPVLLIAFAWCAPPAEAAPAAKAEPEALAAQVKELFRANCFECHNDKKASGGVKILDHARLLEKKKVVPNKTDDSPLFDAITATGEGVMPPTGRTRLNPEQVELVRKWINLGAPAFPADVAVPAEAKKDPAFKDVAGVDHVLKSILAFVRDVPVADRRFLRFFSTNHILTAGATPAELELQRDALVKAINHLSWEPKLVKVRPIDAPVNSVFAIDLRELGWHQTPYFRTQHGKAAGKSHLNIFDLALLEYPYAMAYDDSETFDKVMEEYILLTSCVRPIPYVRADWFCSVCTQPPLYEDFMQMPFNVAELEERLGVDVDGNVRSYVAKRAGMTVSGVSKNNRVVERHPARYGSYWRSFDYKTSRGTDNMFREPVNLTPGGGEFIFNLPNGLQGYYVADNKGNRLEAAPTEIVTDKFAEDKTVRNGLACMRCHDQGTKGFADTVRPAVLKLPGRTVFDRRAALELYPEQKEMDGYLKEDSDRFLEKMARALGKPQRTEPLIPVSHRFLDEALALQTVAGELGLADIAGLQTLFRSPHFAALGLLPLASDGVVRRDAWEDYYDQVCRGVGLGMPIVPLDGEVRRDYPSGDQPFEVEFKTNRPKNLFAPGDELVVSVTNKGGKPLYIELIGTSTKGRKVILASSDTVVRPGETYCWPTPGSKPVIIQPSLGKEQITLLASDREFPAGELLRGKGVTDRVVHRFYFPHRKDGRATLNDDAARMVKKTLEIETK